MKNIIRLIKKLDFMLMCPFLLYISAIVIFKLIVQVTPDLKYFLFETLSTLIIGIILSTKKYILHIYGFILLYIYLFINIKIGSQEYIKHASSIIAIFWTTYYIIVYTIKLIFNSLEARLKPKI